jgi:hypothetical protein
VEKSAYGVAGGSFANVMLHSSINYHQHKYDAGYADRCIAHICYCNVMLVVGITGATGEL